MFQIYQLLQDHWLVIVCGFLFAACRELSEHAKENKFTDWGPWWNTNQSFDNKRTWDDQLGLPSWWFMSVMVWVTDAEHFFQFVSMLFAILAIYILAGFEAALALYIGNFFLGALKPFTRLS